MKLILKIARKLLMSWRKWIRRVLQHLHRHKTVCTRCRWAGRGDIHRMVYITEPGRLIIYLSWIKSKMRQNRKICDFFEDRFGPVHYAVTIVSRSQIAMDCKNEFWKKGSFWKKIKLQCFFLYLIPVPHFPIVLMFSKNLLRLYIKGGHSTSIYAQNNPINLRLEIREEVKHLNTAIQILQHLHQFIRDKI